VLHVVDGQVRLYAGQSLVAGLDGDTLHIAHIGLEPELAALVRVRAAESTARSPGSDEFLALLERRSGRHLRPRKPGRKSLADGATRFANGEIARVSR